MTLSFFCRYEAAKRKAPPNSQAPSSTIVEAFSLDVESVESASEVEEANSLTRTSPRDYQRELYKLVMETERNALVYLPTGLGKTLVATMVVKKLLSLNPERQAVFLVETNALAIQQVLSSRFIDNYAKVMLVVGSEQCFTSVLKSRPKANLD